LGGRFFIYGRKVCMRLNGGPLLTAHIWTCCDVTNSVSSLSSYHMAVIKLLPRVMQSA